MPRKPRYFLTGAVYHVYCRVARGEFVFDSPAEAERFIDVVNEVRDLDGFSVLAWCLMGNHYHLVIRTAEVALWRSMARIQGRVARRFNRQHRFFGRLWQSRYKARVIDTDDYFRQVIAYVHLNPVAAGLVNDPVAYECSGHGALVGHRRSRLVDISAALRGFSSDPKEYLNWIRGVAEARWLRVGIQDLPWWADADNVDEVAAPERHKQAKTFDGNEAPEFSCRFDFADFIRRFEEASDHHLDDLKSPCRNPELLQGRIELVTLAIGRLSFQTRQVALLLNKNPCSVTRWLRIGIRQQRESVTFRARVVALERAIHALGEPKDVCT